MKYSILLASAAALCSTMAVGQETEVVKEGVTEVAKQAAIEQTESVEAVQSAPQVTTVVEEAITQEVVEEKSINLIVPANTSITFSNETVMASDKKEKVKGEKKPPKGQRLFTNPGDTFIMSVKDDVIVDGLVAIPAGTQGFGEVLTVKKRGGFGKSGKIEIQMNHITLNSEQYAMTGTYLQKGKGRGGAAVAGTVIAGVIAGAFIKGDDADIPLTAEVIFHTQDEISLTVDSSNKAPAPAEAESDLVEADEPAEAVEPAEETETPTPVSAE